MHRSCKSMSDGNHYVIIVLVVSLVLCGEAVTHVRILYMVAMTTHKSPFVFHYLGFGRVDPVLLYLYA